MYIMKKIIGISLVILTLNNCTMAQNENSSMAKNENSMMDKNEQMIDVFKSKDETTINISADKLWKIIGKGFADYDEWATIVDHSKGKGMGKFDGAPVDERVCNVNGQGANEVVEKLLQYSDKEMHLKYEAVQGMHQMMSKAINKFTVVRLPKNKSKIVVNMMWGVYGPLDDEMSKMMEGNMNSIMEVFLNDIKVYAETGKVSQVKQKRLDELAKM